MAGLRVGQALGCSGCLGLGSALPAPPPPPMFLGTQPPYATKTLNYDNKLIIFAYGKFARYLVWLVS